MKGNSQYRVNTMLNRFVSAWCFFLLFSSGSLNSYGQYFSKLYDNYSMSEVATNVQLADSGKYMVLGVGINTQTSKNDFYCAKISGDGSTLLSSNRTGLTNATFFIGDRAGR